MKNFVDPKMEVVQFETVDVITSSPVDENCPFKGNDTCVFD